jgi:signal transduction histidine kinase
MVVADLRLADTRSVSIDIEDGLVARGDRTLIHVALINLIGNAWKFTSQIELPRIVIGRHPGEEPVFFVRDNGPGFDMASATQLFTPFHRLHGDAEFAGTGIGLATVRRVVARHGGRIWADAAVGVGATFYFSLPDKPM